MNKFNIKYGHPRRKIDELIRQYIEYDKITGFLYWIKATAPIQVGDRVKGSLNGAGYPVVQFKNVEYNLRRLVYFLVYKSEPYMVTNVTGNKTDYYHKNLRAKFN